MKRKVVSFDLSEQFEKSLFNYIELKKDFSNYVKGLIEADMRKPSRKVELTERQKSFIEFTKKIKNTGE